MPTIDLAHFMLDEAFLDGCGGLLYRSGGTCTFDQDERALKFTGEADFLTYINGLPLAKWRTYADIPNVTLLFEVKGQVSAQVRRAYGHDEGGMLGVQEIDLAAVTHPMLLPEPSFADKAAGAATALEDGYVRYEVPLALDGAVMLGLVLYAPEGACLRDAWFATTVEAERTRPVKLALCTTTFRNEDYILPNMHAVQEALIDDGAWAEEHDADSFHMFVVDNGRTLSREVLEQAGFGVDEGEGGRLHVGAGMTVCPNPNVGGAGGFARGMIEALDDERGFTHVLLMDDDVKVLPESLKRTFALLQLACGRYRDAHVNGAMLNMQDPAKQYEDVGYVKQAGGYERHKTTMDMTRFGSLVRNELVDVEKPNSYGAWWYSCMPVSAIREHGLPLPVFVRCDDVEHGLRCDPTYMVMSGICVWHAQFLGRFRAAVDLYQYGRNMLIAASSTKKFSTPLFMAKYWRNFHMYVRYMSYDAADMWLDALEDYLRGPAWLAAVDGAGLLARNSKKNEQLVPLDELDPQVIEALDVNYDWLGKEESPRSTASKALGAFPHDRHMLPDALLIDEPGFVDYAGSLSPWQETARRRTLVALDGTGEHGNIRTLDRVRYRLLISRQRDLLARWWQHHERIEQEWFEARDYLTSQEFWREYLGLQPGVLTQ